jgi:hypothetical protein
MKTKKHLARWLAVMLLLLIAGTAAIAQPGPYPNSGDHTVCQGSIEPYGVNFTAGHTYVWSIIPNPGGNGILTVDPIDPNLITVEWNTSGEATLQLIETSADGCDITVTINVTINDTPILVINDPDAVCSPATVDLTAPEVTAGSTLFGAVLTYWEDPGATVALVNPNAVSTSGTYYIQAGTAAGCSVIEPVVVIINPSPVLVITDPPAVCSPSTVDITAASVTAGSTLPVGTTLTYWEDAGATVAVADPTAIAVSGIYYILAETVEGCSDIEAVIVTINPTPTPTIVGVDIVCEGDTEAYEVTLNVGNTYNWTVVGGTIDSGQGTNQIFVIWDTPGPGSVQVEETAGLCSDIDTISVTVNPLPTTSDIYHN